MGQAVGNITKVDSNNDEVRPGWPVGDRKDSYMLSGRLATSSRLWLARITRERALAMGPSLFTSRRLGCIVKSVGVFE